MDTSEEWYLRGERKKNDRSKIEVIKEGNTRVEYESIYSMAFLFTLSLALFVCPYHPYFSTRSLELARHGFASRDVYGVYRVYENITRQVFPLTSQWELLANTLLKLRV